MKSDVTLDRNLTLRLNSSGDAVRLSRIDAQRLARALDAYAIEDRAFKPRAVTLTGEELAPKISRTVPYLHRAMIRDVA